MFVCLIQGLIYPWLAFYSLCSQDLLIDPLVFIPQVLGLQACFTKPVLFGTGD